MSYDRNLHELAAMYRRLAGSCRTPEMVHKFASLAAEHEAAAERTHAPSPRPVFFVTEAERTH